MPAERDDTANLAPVSLEAILGSTKDGYWQGDFVQGHAIVSRRLMELLGYQQNPDGGLSRGRFPDMDAVHPDDRARVEHDFQLMVKHRRDEVSHEYRLRTAAGGWLWVQGRSKVLTWEEDGRPRLMCGWVGDISRRRQLEQALGALLEKHGFATVEEHLREAALQLTSVLGVRFAHIGRIAGSAKIVRTVVVVRDGELAANFEYDLEGSPCSVAMAESICAYPRDVQALFPQDRGLARMNVESYLGIALRSRRGEPIGILAAMHDQPMERGDIPEALITLLAERLARELELAETETALEDQMRQAHRMFEQTINGLGLLKEIRGQDGLLDDLRWVALNPALAGHIGDGGSNLIGRTVRQCRDDYGLAVLNLARELDQSGVKETQLEWSGGRWFDVRVYRQDPGMVGLVTSDITHRRMGEEATRGSERRLRGLLANLSQAALVLDANGVVVFVNRAALELVGGEESEVLGAKWFEKFVHEEDRTGIERVMAAPGGHLNCPPHVSNRIRRLDGRERLVEWDMYPLLGPAGHVEALATVGLDVTDARALQERARLAQRMDAVGRLAGGVAHDFNNLLTVINGYVRMIMPRMQDTTVKGYLDEIERAGGKATELTSQLLALSRKQVVQARDFAAHQTISAMQPLVARLLGPGIFLDLELAASNDWIHFDPNAVEQVLLTLAARARDVVPEGGAVKLSTACVMGPQGVQGGVLPEGGYLRMRVEDDGPGMSDQSIAHLFEPFSDPGAGLRPGLELATVYGVLSQGGGGVNVESGNWGTRFDLYFRSAPPQLPEDHPPAAGRRSSLSGTVLLVEDQEQVRIFASDVLRSAGMEVQAVGDASSALAALAQGGGRIGLLLTDVVMPGMSGRDLAMQARQIRPRLPVVFMSGYAESGPSVAELEVLGARFLQKPFTPDQLESAVRAELSKAEPARIVIAEDDAGVRSFLSSVLQEAGYAVTEAEEGAAAIQALKSQPVDLLITDLVMPGQEGIETIRNARQSWPDLKIVAISGAFYGQFLRTASVLGAKAVLQKPIRPEELLNAVREVLES